MLTLEVLPLQIMEPIVAALIGTQFTRFTGTKSTDTDAAAAGSGGDAWDDTHVAGGVTSTNVPSRQYLYSCATAVRHCSTADSVFVLL